MQADIAIVVAAYNRPDCLRRLLHSLSTACYEGYVNIHLVISIDYSGSNNCRRLAEAFEWLHGNKKVLEHQQNLGLKMHILSCGDLVKKYDAVIVLEDDLFVSPFFYDYAQQAYAFYKGETQIAGIALYNYRYNEFAHCPFEPIVDGYDNYFLQVPCSWGQLWTKSQWLSFKEYLSKDDAVDENQLELPAAVLNWPTLTSWKRYFFKYLICERKFFVYPRIALTTNFGDAGTHFSEPEQVWQTPLLIGNRVFRFSEYGRSLSLYDAFFELEGGVYKKITKSKKSVTFDLNGIKPLRIIRTEYLVSSKYCRQAEKIYQAALYPYEKNILFGLTGKRSGSLIFSFGKTSSFASEMPVNRLGLDVKRTLPHLDYLLQTAKDEVEKTLPYRLGTQLLKVLQIPQRVFVKIRTLISAEV